MRKHLLKFITMSVAIFLSSCSFSTNYNPGGGSGNGNGNDTTGNVAVTGVSLNKHSKTLNVNSSFNLTATVSPSNATNSEITWSSSDTSVITVNAGKISSIAAGSATVTVTTVDGGFTDSCEFTVVDNASNEESIAVTGVSLNYSNLSLFVGNSAQLNATISPANATTRSVTWSSSNNNVASVSNGKVTALLVGNATITAITTDGGFTATCLVTVSEQSSNGDIDDSDDNGEDSTIIDDYTPDTTDSSIYTITTASSDTEDGYVVSGNNYKQIYVNAPDEDIVITLNGVTITNDENSPIFVAAADNVKIKAKKDTTNVINDTRSIYTADEEGQGKGAIYVADGDLKLQGKGTLQINANYYNGVHCKDDVDVKNLTLNISAVHHGIKGNDSVTIESGTVDISCGGDGLKTENSDLSSKGNQRGEVTISGGTVTINSWGDAIDASYDAIIEELDSATPTTFTAKTNKYSSYNGEVVDTSSSSFYVKVSSSYSSNYTFAAYINENWYKGTYKTSITNSNGGRPGGGPNSQQTTYYVYEFDKPGGATSFTLYRFAGSNVTSFSTSSANAYSDSKAFNSSFDMVAINSISGSKISLGNWSNYSSATSSANTSKASDSAKGIKAANQVLIYGGVINLTTYDDGIHANKDETLENGKSPLGNIVISDGTITISASDDGIHADNSLTISGGDITITSSYEGLEGNLIYIKGGATSVFATDDGVNACSGSLTPSINVSGGRLDVNVPTSGDTDGIDSNGTYVQSGGVVFVCGPGRASSSSGGFGGGGGACALDTDGTVTISGGTLGVFGSIEQTPSTSNVTKSTSSNTLSAGTRTIKFSSASYTFIQKYSAYGYTVYSVLGSATVS